MPIPNLVPSFVTDVLRSKYRTFGLLFLLYFLRLLYRAATRKPVLNHLIHGENEITRSIVAKCPTLKAVVRPHPLLLNGHVETILCSVVIADVILPDLSEG